MEVVEEIGYTVMEEVLLTLKRHLPGKKWQSDWHPDDEGSFGPGASVMSFDGLKHSPNDGRKSSFSVPPTNPITHQDSDQNFWLVGSPMDG